MKELDQMLRKGEVRPYVAEACFNLSAPDFLRTELCTEENTLLTHGNRLFHEASPHGGRLQEILAKVRKTEDWP